MEVVDVPGMGLYGGCGHTWYGSLWRLWTYLIGVFMEVVDVPGRGLYGGCKYTW